MEDMEKNDLAFSALGQAISYLKKSLLDHKVISLCQYHSFTKRSEMEHHMVLDS